MTATIGDFRTQLDSVFATLAGTAIGTLTGIDLPLLNGAPVLQGLVAGKVFDELQGAISTALAPLAAGDAADAALVTALDDIVDSADLGVAATLAGDGSVTVTLKARDSIPLAQQALPSLDLGGLLSFDASGKVDTAVVAGLDLVLRYDPATDEVTVVKADAPQLSVDLAADITLAAEAKLAVLSVSVATPPGPAAPEITAGADITFATGALDAATSTTVLDDKVALDVGLTTKLAADILPTISTDLVVDYDFLGPDKAAPTVELQDITLDLGGLFKFLGGVLDPIADVLDTFPIGPLIDAVTAKLPIVDDGFGLLGLRPVFDNIGGKGGEGDGTITLLDLVATRFPDLKDPLNAFATALGYIDGFKQAGGGDGTKIDLGDIVLTGGAGARGAPGLAPAGAPPAPAYTPPATDPLSAVRDAAKDQLTGVPGTRPGLGATQPLVDFLSDAGVTIPLLSKPETIVDLLTGNRTVDLITYDVPSLPVRGDFSFFFPIVGPIGLKLGGNFSGLVDFDIGYDSSGLATGDLAKGFYFTTKAKPEGGFEPAATITVGIDASAAISIGIASVEVGGGLKSGLEAFFDGADNKLYLEQLLGDCVFDPIKGKFSAEIFAAFTIDLGFFSTTARFTLAEVTLATFEFGCPPPTTQPDTDLATLGPDASGVPAGTLALNAGERAGFRQINDVAGTDGDESFRVGYAVDADGNRIPGALAVEAYTLTKAFGAALGGKPDPTLILARMGAGRDYVVVSADVTVNADLAGGADGDLVVGGAGNDTLHGDLGAGPAGDDRLYGNAGNDEIFGDEGNDLLEGGAGADLLDAGDGFDQVSYENSPTGVRLLAQPGPNNTFIGQLGDAQGDVIRNAEEFILTNFDDTVFGAANAVNRLNGRDGNDLLYGGGLDDQLQGGAGADNLQGDGGTDSTAYFESNYRVRVDLAQGRGWDGHAQGDRYLSIENVAGTAWDDELTGNGADNILDGWFGNDVLTGGGGADRLRGGEGADTIYAFGGAVEINGGGLLGSAERDLLSYIRKADGGVVARLDGLPGGADPVTRAQVPGIDTLGRPVLVDRPEYSSIEDLEGTNSGDQLAGDAGYNRIWGRGGSDLIAGGGGNDTLAGNAGADALSGGAGFDAADYRESPGAVSVNLAANTGAFADAQGDTFLSVEDLYGSGFSDVLVGDDGSNWIYPGLSRTAVFGDVVDGLGGNDRMFIDYSVEDTGGGLFGGYSTSFLAPGFIVRGRGDGLFDAVVFSNIESLSVVGTRVADQVFAGSGDDVVVTQDGDDFVLAGTGSDQVLAGAGNDTVGSGTTLSRTLTDFAPEVVRFLDGGRGIDLLHFSAGQSFQDIILVGTDGTAEFNGVNLLLANGTVVRNFEVLGAIAIATGFGDDLVEQQGRVDNIISTGAGVDEIRPGLGTDFVDGGLEFGPEALPEGDSNFLGFLDGEDGAFILRNPGDLLVLDYSGAEQAAIGRTGISTTPYFFLTGNPDSEAGQVEVPLETNSGTYVVGPDGVTFTNIERLSVIGTGFGDILAGTELLLGRDRGFEEGTASRRGADILEGRDGDDLLWGKTGSDTLLGGAGSDILIGGAVTSIRSFANNTITDVREVDRLTGGADADTFVLGFDRFFSASPVVLYTDSDGSIFSSFFSTDNRAVVTDFDVAEGDRLQLGGTAANYRLVEQGGSTFLYLRDGLGFGSGFEIGVNSAADELIAEIQGVTGLSLTAPYIRYGTLDSLLTTAQRGALNTDGVAVSAELAIADARFDTPLEPGAAPIAPAPSPAGRAALAASAAPAAWVTQTGDTTVLRDALFAGGAAGIGGGQLLLEGSSIAFGTFDGDPFGLGSGIVLSTGRVADLAGPNEEDGGTSAIQSVNRPFTLVGDITTANAQAARLFKADLSSLGFDLNSLILKDQSAGSGGANGIASGFDLDAVFLSRVNLASVADLGSLPRLDAFAFDAANVRFIPGTQRPTSGPGDFINARDLLGALNGLPVFAQATLDAIDGRNPLAVDGSGGFGALTLGDGGSIGFDLKAALPGDGPLYLYAVEFGGAGEQLSAGITASSNRLAPKADLSTDLGLPGLDGDSTALVYRFTPDASVNAIAFEFALATEELTEWAQSGFNDSFRIKVNGANLARLSDGSFATIDNLYAPPGGQGIALSYLNLFGSSPQRGSDLVLNPVGTGPAAAETRADAYSKVLRFVAPVKAGEVNELRIEVEDVRDALLDSAILVRGGSLKGFWKPDVIIRSPEGPLKEGGTGTLHVEVTVPPGGRLDAPVTVTLDPTDGIDLGNGPGRPVTIVFDPDGPTKRNIDVKAPQDFKDDGDRVEKVDVTVDGGTLPEDQPTIVLPVQEVPFAVEQLWFGIRAVGFENGGSTGPQFEAVTDAAQLATRSLPAKTVPGYEGGGPAVLDFTGSEWQQLLAFRGKAPAVTALGIDLSDGIDGAQTGRADSTGDLRVGPGVVAANLADMAGGGRISDVTRTLDAADDPVVITGLGPANPNILAPAVTEGDGPANFVTFSGPLGFGFLGGTGWDLGGNAQRLNGGESIGFALQQGRTLDAASFVVRTTGGAVGVVLDSDGVTMRDTNGAARGGFVQDASAGELVLGDLADGTAVKVDFRAGTVLVNGAAGGFDAGGFFAAFAAAGADRITFGSLVGQSGGWSVDDLVLLARNPVVAPAPAPGADWIF
ncbi:choice-of-anchor L domain-containing protein [Paracraurococcus ruber]|uniref:Calcium-binding protein n=1 Tax=Paracraurococcus ruber TaxID=77675 RepID=A0ABS1CSR1_9PROT|nr:choice-of-anchor L domain-containing protein [Paracraurococcus ruber]MBK1657032.1 hypothetical protein [Paracraurococcus ruber]TDG32526.1 calcium-binding protein [Paracraurococcus ruber]